MIFSARQYSALFEVYARMFGQPVPADVAEAAAQSGNAPNLMRVLELATSNNQAIHDWPVYETRKNGEALQINQN